LFGAARTVRRKAIQRISQLRGVICGTTDPLNDR
jgi:hypothetical protein